MDYNLERFVKAQEYDYARALSEIENGRKRTHWMRYIFPQLEQLGRSSTAKYYGISNLCEAREYIAHPILGVSLTMGFFVALWAPKKNRMSVLLL